MNGRPQAALRYSALLIANSIVSGLIVKQESAEIAFILGGCVLGIILCIFWWIIIEDGWRFFSVTNSIAGRFDWPNISNDINPIKAMLDEFDRLSDQGRLKFINRFNGGDRLKTLSFGVILLFIIFYIYFSIAVLFI